MLTTRMLLAVGLLVLVIVVFLVGIWQFGRGLDQKVEYAARGHRVEMKEMSKAPLAVLDRWLRRTNLGGYVHRRLSAAGMNVSVTVFLALMTVTSVGAVVLAWRYLAPIFGIGAIGVVAWAFFQFLRQMEDRRREEFIGQLPELARILSNSFSAGLALRTAVEIAADELDDPARRELQLMADGLKLGQPTDEALEELGDRLPSRELSVLVSTLVISSRAGGSMVTALRNLSKTLDDRKEIRREVKTVLAQATYTGYLIAGLGIGELFLINAFVPDGLHLLTTNPVGIAILVISAAFYILGLVVMNRMSKVDT